MSIVKFNKEFMNIHPLRKTGPLITQTQFTDTKDPCPVFDGKRWHIFGSGGDADGEKWKILHAVAPEIEGPWAEQAPVRLVGLSGDHVCAPGVVFDPADKLFHMFIQTDFLATEGTVEHLSSPDGDIFKKRDTPLKSIPNSEESGIYDPHPATIADRKYLVYSGTPFVGWRDGRFMSTPDIFLAKSSRNAWDGPWERLGKILGHKEIAEHHNQIGSPDYEWGIEGAQLLELPNGKILLNATCFLPSGVWGSRQRVFFAMADSVMGPYQTLGSVLTQMPDEWECGENGHAAAVVKNNFLYLFYQARASQDKNFIRWRYGIAIFDANALGETG
jgi:hypothetical protein